MSIKLSKHSEKRINQRGFRKSNLELIRRCGTPIHDPDLEKWRWQAIPSLCGSVWTGSARRAEHALSNWNFPKSRPQGMFCKPMRRSLMQWHKVASRQTRLAPSQASWRSSADQSRPVNWKPGLPNWRTLEAGNGVKAPEGFLSTNFCEKDIAFLRIPFLEFRIIFL